MSITAKTIKYNKSIYAPLPNTARRNFLFAKPLSDLAVVLLQHHYRSGLITSRLYFC